MKILFLTPWYPDAKTPHHGVFVREQAAAMAEGEEVQVISSKIDYQQFGLCSWSVEESTFQGLIEHRIVIKRSLPIFNQLNYFLISVGLTYKIASRFQPDILHGNIGYPGGFWTYLVSKLIRRPFLMTEHYSRFTYNFRSAIHRSLTIFSLKRASRLISVSSHSAKEINKYVDRPIDIVPNLIDTNRFSVKPPQEEVCQLGFLGGLSSPTHQKGLDLLLNALSKIEEDFVLHIGGAGDFLELYQEQARQMGVFRKCRFYGFVPYAAVPAFINELHIFVSPSRFESFGIAMVEAMASGVPVVAANSGGPADFINEYNGLLVEKENEEALRVGIIEMMKKHTLMDRQRIREYAVLNFSRDCFRTTLGVIYNQVK